jgi:hypothetical protein
MTDPAPQTGELLSAASGALLAALEADHVGNAAATLLLAEQAAGDLVAGCEILRFRLHGQQQQQSSSAPSPNPAPAAAVPSSETPAASAPAEAAQTQPDPEPDAVSQSAAEPAADASHSTQPLTAEDMATAQAMISALSQQQRKTFTDAFRQAFDVPREERSIKNRITEMRHLQFIRRFVDEAEGVACP